MKRKTLGSLLLGLAVLVGFTIVQPVQAKSINVVSSLNFYGEAAKAVGGKNVQVTSIVTNPNTDPHEFQPTTSDAKKVSMAQVVIENGLGYDSWMNKLVKADKPEATLNVQQLVHAKNGANEHLWYQPNTMTTLTKQLVKTYSKLDPSHKKTYQANADKYLKKLDTVQTKLDAIKKDRTKSTVAVTEPVFDYQLSALGYKVSDEHFAKAIEDSTDPSPKDVQSLQKSIRDHKVAFLVVNKQTENKVVNNIVKLAKKEKVPIVDVTETLPKHKNYVTWMTSQLDSVQKAQQKDMKA